MASDLGLHCLSMSQKNDARLIWVERERKRERERDRQTDRERDRERSSLLIASTDILNVWLKNNLLKQNDITY